MIEIRPDILNQADLTNEEYSALKKVIETASDLGVASSSQKVAYQFLLSLSKSNKVNMRDVVYYIELNCIYECLSAASRFNIAAFWKKVKY